MGKWLAFAAVAVIAVAVLLWRELSSSSAEPVRADTKVTPAVAPTPVARAVAAPTPDAALVPEAAAADASTKLATDSDAFFYQFVEAVPKKLTAQAAVCYEGITKRVHRNQKLSLRLKTKIRNGEVTVTDVTIKENTLNNPALEACFIQQVQRATWRDDVLPDYDGEDELVLRPERGMKKFMRDNTEYVGKEAPRD